MNNRIRIALYSHDTVGLGHMRRNLLIATALAGGPLEAAILMIAGNSHANAFSPPTGVDSVTLPALHKNAEGRYDAGTLPLSLQRLVTIRARTIRAALEAFDPDLLIVDKVPRGALGELMPALELLKSRGRCRCVLGLRDVLDEPSVVQWEWSEAQNEAAIEEHYAAVWIYGDRRVYDLAEEYDFGQAVRSRLVYTGYLDQRARLEAQPAGMVPTTLTGLPAGPTIICSVGGGQDGACVAQAFVSAELPPQRSGVLLTGPFMPPQTRYQITRATRCNGRMLVLPFVAEATRLLASAERVVAMGGYNTVAEVLSFDKTALVVPRVKPRREQLIRAERLQALGLVDVLHPDELEPDAISQWLASPRTGALPRTRVDLAGLPRISQLARELLQPVEMPVPSYAR
jgi:predicted glycosyltransferase